MGPIGDQESYHLIYIKLYFLDVDVLLYSFTVILSGRYGNPYFRD